MSGARTIVLFVIAVIAEIGGAGFIWQGVREDRGIAWIGAGIAALGAYGFVATLQDDNNFGVAVVRWDLRRRLPRLGHHRHGFRPDRWDHLGSVIRLVGVGVIMFAPRG